MARSRQVEPRQSGTHSRTGWRRARPNRSAEEAPSVTCTRWGFSSPAPVKIGGMDGGRALTAAELVQYVPPPCESCGSRRLLVRGRVVQRDAEGTPVLYRIAELECLDCAWRARPVDE